MKICIKCGQIVAEKVNICPVCGAEMAASRAAIDEYQIAEVLHEELAAGASVAEAARRARVRLAASDLPGARLHAFVRKRWRFGDENVRTRYWRTACSIRARNCSTRASRLIWSALRSSSAALA